MSDITAEEYRTAAKVLRDPAIAQGGDFFKASDMSDRCEQEAARLESESVRHKYVEQLAKVFRERMVEFGFLMWKDMNEPAKAAHLAGIAGVLDQLAADGRLLPEGMGVAAWSIGPAPTATSVEFQVEKLARILADFAVADEHSGTRNDMQLARLLVARGVRVNGGAS
ncbi:hypothetical protein [Prescottella equi]|uniref:hypothetical protein n=1 Tax=Rhodococcus hoagii TaxID=43767 RepID=UPI000A10496F|nr:hypothetical protein [Prescottella equi]ORM21810.1 hypothetical protein A5N74_03120 [Prescottella equi]